jgi:TatD DNase family protein
MIDAHCHLDLYQNPEEVAREIEKKQITTIAVTNLPSHFIFSAPYVRPYKNIHLALGMHPLLSESYSDFELQQFKKSAKQTLFIGEIGLDFSEQGKATARQQLIAFSEILQSINDRPRFISIHSRGAEEVISDLILQYQIKKAVFHWYSGRISVLDKIIEAGHYLSINPMMISSKKGQKIIDRLPRNFALTETDGPYVRIGKRIAKPDDVIGVLVYLAKVWEISVNEAEYQVFENFQRIIDPIRKNSKL